MKNLILLLLCFIALLFNSCKKDADLETYLTYKVDGVAKTTNRLFAELINGSSNSQIIGVKDAEQVTLKIAGAKTGTYQLPDNASINKFGYAADLTGDGFYGAITGSVTITVVTKTYISGTFQFTGKSINTGLIKTITEGRFTCKFNNALLPATKTEL
ncbi:hypothetical protein HQ865_24080 [Mucilaginibacter mali]|uniref:DUF4843 domain-containing protein n=1 Tax=Mucilaginibacter mali TaxID=2740462 RepID=A0A7D4Q753_9SPHI|nr:DUF6252 family protein [Mucilaginibacter mali]QKJ32707.1 hypothetical protein HQ865_24080 [Mucilaginibacter mali]